MSKKIKKKDTNKSIKKNKRNKKSLVNSESPLKNKKINNSFTQDVHINSGEKTSYDLLSYDLDMFNTLSNICKNLNISYDKLYSNNNNSPKIKNLKDKNKENNNENIIISSNDKDNININNINNSNEFNCENKKTNRKKSKKKKDNESGISVNKDGLKKILKEYSLKYGNKK